MAHGLQSGLRDGGLSRGGLHAGLGNGSIFNIASLDLNFAKYKNVGSLVTFTRASSGTFVGSDGLLQSAVTNLLLRSEEFDNAAFWGIVGGGASIVANQLAAPNGAITADKVNETNVTNSFYCFQGASFVSGLTYTLSVYAKKGERNFVALRLPSGAFGSNTDVYFNLNTGAVGTTVNSPTASIVSVGDGWYRCSITKTATATSVSNLIIFVANVDGTVSYAGTAGSGIFLWGAQLEQSTTAGEYIPTTSAINSAPRFDHNPTTGESLGLLVEEQRSNLFLQSENLLTTWTALDGLSRTANQVVAPNGFTTADLLASNGTLTGYLEQPNASSNQFVSGTTYSYSVYLKKANTSTCLTLLYGITFNSGGGSPIATWNLDTGVPTFVDGATGSMTAVGNGWYRCVITDTATQTHTQNQQWLRMVSPNGDVYAWGAQLEQGAFATSYIATTTAAATRSADVASITGSAFSGFYRQDEGTMFVNATTNATHGGSNSFPRQVSINDGTNDNSIEQYYRVLAPYTNAGYRVDAAGVNQAQFDTNNQRNGQSSVIGYAANNYAFAVGGTVVNTDLSGTVPTTTQLRLGRRGDGSSALNGTIRRICYWPTRLSNQVLQSITQ